jgi:putative spermidine/putrescine transport system permease protein
MTAFAAFGDATGRTQIDAGLTDPEPEVRRAAVRAAAGLGAGPWYAFRTVILPAILPGLAGGAAFAFVTSFDEVIISIFIAGYGAKTLPVKLWEEIRVEFTPVVAAGATIILLMTVVVFVVTQLLRGRAQRRAAAENRT